MSELRKKDFLLPLACLALLGAFLRCLGIGAQPPSGDDLAVAYSAWNYVDWGNLGPTMWNHPPLRNILVYLTMEWFGTGVWGVKAVSLALGSISVLLLGLTARRLFRDGRVALMSAFFLAVDALHIDFSRQAVHEVYMLCFSLGGIYLALLWLDGAAAPEPSSAAAACRRRRGALLWGSALCFGLGLSSKWYVLFPLLSTGAFLLYRLACEPEGNRREKAAVLLHVVTVYTCIPLAVYLLTFIPWFQRGYSLWDWLSLQGYMYRETVSHSGYNPSRFEVDYHAYLWFVKPVAFADFTFGAARPVVLLGIANPLVWLPTIPSMLFLLRKGWAEADARRLFVVALFVMSYLPLVATSRPIWAHTAFAVLPFAFMATAYAACTLAQRPRWRVATWCYLTLALACSAPLYLLATGKGLDSRVLTPVVELYRPENEKNR